MSRISNQAHVAQVKNGRRIDLGERDQVRRMYSVGPMKCLRDAGETTTLVPIMRVKYTRIEMKLQPVGNLNLDRPVPL